MPATTQTRKIIISVDTKGSRELKDISDRLGGVSKSAKSLAGNFQFLTSAFTGYLSTLGVRELARMSDEMQNLSNRIKIVSLATEDTNKVMEDLLTLANRTKQSVSDVGEIYARLGSSLKAANITSGSLLEITESLINSFRISGSTGTETAATIIQLSQSFAKGALQGQELRSVMLQNAELAKLLRERFGPNLAKDAEAGLISITEVLKLLRVNQERINKTAETLTITFEQGLTKAINKVQFSLFLLNKEFNLSGKFAAGLDVVAEKFTLILTLVGVLALSRIPALISSLQALTAAAFAFAATNPLTAALALTGVLILSTSENLTDFIDKIRNLGAWAAFAAAEVLNLVVALDKKLIPVLQAVGLNVSRELADLSDEINNVKALQDLAESLGTAQYRPSPLDPNKTARDSDKEFNDLLGRLDKLYKGLDKSKKPKEVLAELNKEFSSGVMTLKTYSGELVNFQLYKLNQEFKEGKIDVLKYNEALAKIQETGLRRELNAGQITLREFNSKITELKITELNQKFEAGTVGLVEYNTELTKVSQAFLPGSALIAGTNNFIESIGTISSNVADAITKTFGSLEDALVDFVQTGKFNFRDFTKAVLDDLTRIIIRASIIRPLAQGILGAAVGGGPDVSNVPDSGQAYAAKGMAFDRVKKFASGGIVSGPTNFGYGGGKRGLMGEAGPEAIIPLRRSGSGELGVSASVTPVNINIINQGGGEVKQTETTGPSGEKTIEILILGKVKDGIMSGQLDSTMKSAYGIKRRGG